MSDIDGLANRLVKMAAPSTKTKKMLETELRFIKMQVANMNNRITNIEVILQDLKWAEEENEKL